MDESEPDYSKLFPGYKPNPPRDNKQFTAAEMRKLQDFAVLLKKIKKKNMQQEDKS